MDANFTRDMRISLLAAITTTAKGMLEPSFYDEWWKDVFNDNVMVTAIEDNTVFHKVLESFIYGMFADQVVQGIAYIRSLEK